MYTLTPFGSYINGSHFFLSLLDGMLLGLIIFLVCYFACFRKKKNTLKRNVCTGLLFVYLGALVSLTMYFVLPGGWNPSMEALHLAVSNIRFFPLQTIGPIFENCARIGNYHVFFYLAGGNFIMLMPLSILVKCLWPGMNFWKTCVLALCASVGVESLQFASNVLAGSPVRTVEMDDIILNVTGCVFAYFIFVALLKLFRRIFRRRRGN